MDSDAPNCENNEVYINPGEGEGIEGNPDVENENSPSLCVRISCMLFSCQADRGLERIVTRTKDSCDLVQMPAMCIRRYCLCMGSKYPRFISSPNHYSPLPGTWMTEKIYDISGLSLLPSQ